MSVPDNVNDNAGSSSDAGQKDEPRSLSPSDSSPISRSTPPRRMIPTNTNSRRSFLKSRKTTSFRSLTGMKDLTISTDVSSSLDSSNNNNNTNNIKADKLSSSNTSDNRRRTLRRSSNVKSMRDLREMAASLPSSSSPPTIGAPDRRGFLKRKSSLKSFDVKDIPISTKSRSWKVLGSPNMKQVEDTAKQSECLRSSFQHGWEQPSDALSSSSCSDSESQTIEEEPEEDIAIATMEEEQEQNKAEEKKRRPRLNRAVSFNNISIREYDLTLGDHPNVKKGPPVSLDWKYEQKNDIDLEQFEETRQGERAENKKKMKLKSSERMELLLDTYGHTEEELERVEIECNMIKDQRAATTLGYCLGLDMVEDALESTKRKAKRATKKTAKTLKSVEQQSMSLLTRTIPNTMKSTTSAVKSGLKRTVSAPIIKRSISSTKLSMGKR